MIKKKAASRIRLRLKGHLKANQWANQKGKNMLMHRKNNQKGIKKPIIGHNKANWF